MTIKTEAEYIETIRRLRAVLKDISDGNNKNCLDCHYNEVQANVILAETNSYDLR